MSAKKRPVTVPSEPTRHAKTVALVAVGLLIGLLIGLLLADQREGAQPLEAGVITETAEIDGPDPFEAYEAARTARQPMYVLFHSGPGCPPCREAREIASRILPEYEESVAYVDAHTVDPRSWELFQLDQFTFRSVPTSVFLAADGTIAEQITGPMSEEDLRERLDALVAEP